MLRDVFVVQGHALHCAEPKSSIRHLIDDRRPRCHDPVFDAEVRFAVRRNAVTRPVPAVNGAVVDLERTEFWCFASADGLPGILLDLAREQDAEAANIFFIYIVIVFLYFLS